MVSYGRRRGGREATWSHWTYVLVKLDVQKRPEEPSRSRSEFEEVWGGGLWYHGG